MVMNPGMTTVEEYSDRQIRAFANFTGPLITILLASGQGELLAGTILGKNTGTSKYEKYTAAVAALLVTGVVADNNAILWTAKTAGAAGNAIKVKIEDTGINGQALDVVIDEDTVIVKAARGAGVAASLDTGVVGDNNAVTFTAKTAGAAGNAIKVSLINPGANSQPLEVKLVNDEIRVMLATSGAGALTSTAAQVIAAVNSALYIKDLVTAANTGASSGAAAVVAAAAAPLANGADGAITSTAAHVIAAVNAALNNEFVTAANSGASTGAGVVAAVAATALAAGANSNVVPGLVLEEYVPAQVVDVNVRAYLGGIFYSNMLVGMDANAKAALNAREAADLTVVPV
jgi:hypothetical protein